MSGSRSAIFSTEEGICIGNFLDLHHQGPVGPPGDSNIGPALGEQSAGASCCGRSALGGQPPYAWGNMQPPAILIA